MRHRVFGKKLNRDIKERKALLTDSESGKYSRTSGSNITAPSSSVISTGYSPALRLSMRISISNNCVGALESIRTSTIVKIWAFTAIVLRICEKSKPQIGDKMSFSPKIANRRLEYRMTEDSSPSNERCICDDAHNTPTKKAIDLRRAAKVNSVSCHAAHG